VIPAPAIRHLYDRHTVRKTLHNNNNNNLGRKLAVQSGNDREISFLFQRLSVLVQQYNTILLHDCFVKEE